MLGADFCGPLFNIIAMLHRLQRRRRLWKHARKVLTARVSEFFFLMITVMMLMMMLMMLKWVLEAFEIRGWTVGG